VTISFQIDPCEVLGVGPEASLQEIRDAYRSRSKVYHPDAGGHPWAFRVLVRSYEALSQARVAAKAHAEAEAERGPAPAGGGAAGRGAPRVEPIRVPTGGDGASVRRGVTDKVADPSLLVAVETLVIRFEEHDPHAFFLRPAEERNLSCTLQVHWPIADLVPRRGEIAGADRRLEAVGRAFEAVETSTRPTSSRSAVEDGRFSGWLTYPTVARLDAALAKLRAALAPHAMGAQQTIREHNVPRDWAG
jgi:hypothetical protein